MRLCIKNVGFTNDGKTKTIQGRHDHLQDRVYDDEA